LRSVLTNECGELVELARGDGVYVQADGPKAGALFNRAPQLLGDPCEAAAQKRPACETVG
jgi:hypothetical protein